MDGLESQKRRSEWQSILHIHPPFIGKTWKTHPEFFRNFSFPGCVPITGKLIQGELKGLVWFDPLFSNDRPFWRSFCLQRTVFIDRPYEPEISVCPTKTLPIVTFGHYKHVQWNSDKVTDVSYNVMAYHDSHMTSWWRHMTFGDITDDYL